MHGGPYNFYQVRRRGLNWMSKAGNGISLTSLILLSSGWADESLKYQHSRMFWPFCYYLLNSHMAEVSEIIEFLKDRTGAGNVSENTDIANDLGVDGDDYDELIREFSKKYNVDVSSCLWYFHWSEEGSWNSIGGTIFQSPDKRVEHIAVTPIMLSEFTKAGKWNIEYPDHKLPKWRYDIIINQILVIVFILFLLYKCVS